jgi:hypothetical protein
MDKPISAPLLSTNAVANIGDSKPIGEPNQFTRKSAVVEHFLYLEKLYLLTQEYLGLNLPLTDSLRAAEADLWSIAHSVQTTDPHKQFAAEVNINHN